MNGVYTENFLGRKKMVFLKFKDPDKSRLFSEKNNQCSYEIHSRPDSLTHNEKSGNYFVVTVNDSSGNISEDIFIYDSEP